MVIASPGTYLVASPSEWKSKPSASSDMRVIQYKRPQTTRRDRREKKGPIHKPI
jgi:hypothetical protein